MYRFLVLVFYCLSCAICNNSNEIQLLGLFPKQVHYDKQGVAHKAFDWSQESQAMFHAAIRLANDEQITIHGHTIAPITLETTNEGNGLGVLDRVCQQISIHKSAIVGIVGPVTSNNARFLGPFAAKIDLPMISYAATNPELSDRQLYPRFFRMAPSDIVLARAIVELFVKFNWTTCAMIVQKDDYGYGGLRIMTEMYHKKITVYDRLTFDVNIEDFSHELKSTLENSLSRIILVWADEHATTLIIKEALKCGLLGRSYIWILTDTIDLAEFPPEKSLWTNLTGLLAVRPTDGFDISSPINHGLLGQALPFFKNNSVSLSTWQTQAQPYNISSFALYAFDATWLFIQALNQTSKLPKLNVENYCFNASLKNGDEYHKILRNMSFLGVSGHVEYPDNISNDRIYGAFFVLKNLQEHNGKLSFKRVLKWLQSNNSQWTNVDTPPISSLVWPNGAEKTPAHFPEINGQTLKIRVIESPPFVIVINRSSESEMNPSERSLRQFPLNTNNHSIQIEGYIADLINLLQKKMNFIPSIDVAPVDTPYDILVQSVLDTNDTQSWDVVISDVTITSSRLRIVDFSHSIHENSVRIAIRYDPSVEFDFFLFIKPFSWQVWTAIFSLVIYSGLLIYFFERRVVDETKEEHRWHQSIGIGVLQAVTRIIGMGNDVAPTTISSRMLSIGLGALCMILVATYTANFSSVLTLERTQPWISGIDDIKNGRLQFNRIGVVIGSSIDEYYRLNVSSSCYPLQSTREIYTHLLEGRIDAALWDSTALEYTIEEKYSQQLAVIGAGFAKSSFGIAMKHDWRYKATFDQSIVSLREEDALEELEKKWFRSTARTKESSNESGDDSSKTSLPIEVMGGLFASFFVLSLLTITIHFWRFRTAIKSDIRKIWKNIFKKRRTSVAPK